MENDKPTYEELELQVAELKRINDETLLRDEKLYKDLFNSMSENFMLIDLIRDPEDRVIDHYFLQVNPSFKKLVGKTDEELIGKRAKEVFENIDDYWLDIFDKVDREGKPISYSNHSGEMKRYYTIHAWRLDEGIIAITFSDITDQKKGEEELLSSQAELRELNATKDKFFSIITHDLLSPFNNVMGFCELLVENITVKNYESIEEYGNIIQQASQKTTDLLLNLIEWSRSQTDRIEFTPEFIELGEVIVDIVELENYSAQLKSISISTEIPAKVQLFADRAIIQTVIRNLITNSIKYTTKGGHIIVTAHIQGDECLVSVKDNGVGMKNNVLDGVFKIGEGTSADGTQGESGTGLGLILCKEFVDKHGGEIWAESELGVGSTFTVKLPVGKTKSTKNKS